MLDPKVAEDAYHAWENFVLQVSRLESRMLTAMAEKIDKRWADMVAETPKERHDAATCCGGRQEPDVGEGWRDVRTGEDAEHLADGDWVQDADGFWEPISRFMWNGFGCPCKRYRRRVTPVAEAKAKVLPLYADGAWAEIRSAQSNAMLVAALRAEVERMKAEQRDLRQVVAARNVDTANLTAEVERLRLTREEREAIAFFRDEAFDNFQKRYRSELGKLLERLGGAE